MAAILDNVLAVETDDEASNAVWVRFAQSYAAFGSPFVPCHEDIQAFEKAVAHYACGGRAVGLTALMLGVTPGVAMMNWPQRTRIVAVEVSPVVINALWPGDIPGVREAICASWLAIPRPRRSCDVVIADGSLSTCRFPDEVRSLLRAVADLLADDGIFVCRCYVQPIVQESVDAVFAAAFSADGLSVDHFKMRLYTAMQRSAGKGVAVKEAARIMARHGVDRKAMKERFGWSDGVIAPFLAWPVLESVYSFPSLNELCELVSEYFDVLSVSRPEYELGERCPTMVMRPNRFRP